MVIINSTLVKKGGDVGFRNLGPTLYKNKAFSDPTAIFFKPDGTKLYYARANSTTIYQYTLSTPWDISTATSEKSISLSISGAKCIRFSSDGLNMYLSGGTGILQHTLSTAWDISTATYSQTSSNTSLYQFCFNPDGTKIVYIRDQTSLYYANLSTPWDISTINSATSKSGIEDSYVSVTFSTDGTKFYTHYGYFVYEYHLTTPFDLSTASSLRTVLNTEDWVDNNISTDFAFSQDGLYLYLANRSSDKIYQLKMPQ